MLRDEIREFAVDAFVHPPSDDALAALDSDDPGEAAEKRALLEIQNTSDADLLDRLTAAEEDLEVQRQLAEDASARAEAKQAEAADRLEELTAARDQQAAYAAQVQTRLDRKLSEAAPSSPSTPSCPPRSAPTRPAPPSSPARPRRRRLRLPPAVAVAAVAVAEAAAAR